PAYARPWRETREVAQGSDGRGIDMIRPAVLAGSTVTVDLSLNRDIEVPVIPDSEWLARTVGWTDDHEVQFTRDSNDGSKWNLKWKAGDSRRLVIALEDQFGLQSIEPLAIQIPVEPDDPPDVILADPDQDLDVLPSATFNILAEAVDDLPLETIGIQIKKEGTDDWLVQSNASTVQ
ncbi:MAG: hypothetical protein MK089_13305, partial [Phycisphaerales bacterium]|nr:hypothetical protein [Phycisphaerales bacterium]